MNRFKEQRIAHGYKTQSDLAKVLFVNQTAVSQWERGATIPSPPLLLRLSNMYDVTTDYLLGNDSTAHSPSSPNGVMVPVLGDVAGGLPMLAQENIIDYEEVSKDLTVCGDIIGLRVNGHSMEPRVCDGDVVIVRLQGDVDTGDVAVVLINGDSATVKKIKKDADGSIWLIPNNPAYDAVHYSPQERDDLPVTIIGKVVELRGKF
ncbi:XRE family transcriptional regulator [Oscillibacter sp.]|uniref:LexA family protein n=1 Tax=Oscillibacter sp. TaxID=1945593 RepID=UPI00289F9522|nr:XRE family transcriptional regulator [Oscillibacter sp.]